MVNMRQMLARSRTFRVLLGAALVLGIAWRAPASPYKVTVLDGDRGHLLSPGEIYLNNLGQVAGDWMQNGLINGMAPLQQPYFYDPTAGGRVTLLGYNPPSAQGPGGPNPQFQNTSFLGLNNLGQAVTNSANGPMLFDSRTGQVTSLPGPAGPITDSGQVVGSQEVAAVAGNANFLPYSEQNGQVQNLGAPPGAIGAEVQAINNPGQVLVHAALSPGGFIHSYLLSGGKWTDLGNFYGAAINDQGTIAGNTGYVTGQPTHAAIIPAGGSPIDLGTLPRDTFSTAEAINSHGQVVGLSFSQNSSDLYRGFLYQNGVMTDLNSLLAPGSGWLIKWGLAINDVGQILALGDNGTKERTLLLTPGDLPTPPDPVFPEAPIPAPEPSAMVVFGFLAVALACRASHRPGKPMPSGGRGDEDRSDIAAP